MGNKLKPLGGQPDLSEFSGDYKSYRLDYRLENADYLCVIKSLRETIQNASACVFYSSKSKRLMAREEGLT